MDEYIQRQLEQRAQKTMRSWIEQADQLKDIYPDFDIFQETQNPVFLELLKAGHTVRHAYEAAHQIESQAVQVYVEIQHKQM